MQSSFKTKKPKYNLQTLGHDTGDLKASLNALFPPPAALAVKQNKGEKGLRMGKEGCWGWAASRSPCMALRPIGWDGMQAGGDVVLWVHPQLGVGTGTAV